MKINEILTESQLSGWGTDDSIVLHAIATNLGANVVGILTGTTNNLY